MNYKHFIGIDVSKGWLDFTVRDEQKTLFHLRKENTITGIKGFFKALKAIGFKDATTLFCMEHTGIYNNHLLNYLNKINANLCLESGLQIKHSSGLKRGKNDKIDSERIADYAYKNRGELRLWKPKREIIQTLKYLTSQRDRLTTALKQLKTPIEEARLFIAKKDSKMIDECCKHTIAAVRKDLKKINQAILELIKSDEELNRIFNLVHSVTGVGPVTAVGIIITTNEFKTITCPKKFACNSGIAPFEHQSGSSVRGKTRVSSLGNKTTKKLLHMAALSASICKGDLRDYFTRKVAEGKNKMLVLNALRNKLVDRIFACVRNNRTYEKKYANSLFYP